MSLAAFFEANADKSRDAILRYLYVSEKRRERADRLRVATETRLAEVETRERVAGLEVASRDLKIELLEAAVVELNREVSDRDARVERFRELFRREAERRYDAETRAGIAAEAANAAEREVVEAEIREAAAEALAGQYALRAKVEEYARLYPDVSDADAGKLLDLYEEGDDD